MDFYSGIIYQAMGYPTDYFTVLFALGRLPDGSPSGRKCSWTRTPRSPVRGRSTPAIRREVCADGDEGVGRLKIEDFRLKIEKRRPAD